jgi:hypothetical protein
MNAIGGKGKRYLSFCPSVGVKPTGKLRLTVACPGLSRLCPFQVCSLAVLCNMELSSISKFQLPNLLPILGNHVAITE